MLVSYPSDSDLTPGCDLNSGSEPLTTLCFLFSALDLFLLEDTFFDKKCFSTLVGVAFLIERLRIGLAAASVSS
jgi:hypothetical protein